MADKGRRALGRGLGSLIPSGDEIVSRETIVPPEKATDVFFPAEGGDSRERKSSAITADLLKPPVRKRGSQAASKRHSRSKTTQVADEKNTQSSAQKTLPRQSVSEKKELFEDIIGDSVASHSENIEREEIVSRETISDERLVPVPGARFAEIPIAAIIPNLHQPREVFDEDELAELSQSIQEIGVLQPVVVRPIGNLDERYEDLLRMRHEEGVTGPPSFELIMGERRLRASKLAGYTTIPAIIRQTDDTNLLRDALLENLHRTQLNPIEEAAAYQQLMRDFDCTQEVLSARIAKSRSHIANTVRLLNLPGSVQRKLAAGVISAGHARALLSLTSKAQMEILGDRIVAEGLSVRSTEEIVALGDVTETVATRRGARRIPPRPSDDAIAIIDQLTDLLDTRITVKEGKRRGRIMIEYAGTDDLTRLANVIRHLKSTASPD
ncbi:MAG: ParB/RepB/Spo0J family partition protein [Actinomycetaceae bacterium]|nr:ParB/RepB/Spo0J family partition protein [Actinomycetaceae bacterium]